jgi:2-dehydropantoate 2-reductase
MDVVVVGAGATGGALAGYLAGGGHNVTALDEWPAHVAAINRDGLRVGGARGSHSFRFTAALWEELPSLDLSPELILVSVKAYDTQRAAAVVGSLLGPTTVVVSTQNGINEDVLAETLGRDRIVGAVTEIGGYVVEPGEIAETRADGGFVIGELDGADTPRVHRVQEVLSSCAPTTITPNIRGLLWSKLTWNCMLNPLTALTGLGQGEVWTEPSLRDVAVQLGREARNVARADGAELQPLTFFGVDLPALLGDDVDLAEATLRRVIEIYRPQMGKSTSMREDVKLGRRTEIEFLNGHVARLGESLGVPVELNRDVVRVVQSIESGELSPSPELVKTLARAANSEGTS